MILTTLPLAFILAVLFYVYSTWTYDYWKIKGVAYVKPQPFFGNIFDLLTFKKSVPDVLLDIYRSGTGSSVIGYYQFRSPALMIRDPGLVKKVLVTDYDCFNEFYSVDSNLDPLLSRNPFVLTGDVWKAVRALLSPAFTSPMVRNLFPLMAVECREMIQYLEKHAPQHRSDGLSVRDLTSKFTTDVVVRCGFGIFGNSFSEHGAVMRKVGEDFSAVGFFKAFKYLLYTLIPDIRKYLNLRFLDVNGQHFFTQLIRELILYRERNKVFRNDYLQMLMHVKYMGTKSKGKNIIRVAGVDMEFTDEDIASHALTLFFTGYDLPSFVMSFALHQLAINPAVQNKLRAEIDEILMNHSGGLTYEAVDQMTYLDMVISETLRMHPPFQMIPRICTKPCQLPLPNGGSFLLEKGTAVIIPAEALHMDPEHFPEPNTFDPERFSVERRRNINPYSYLPYSAGPRQCFGMRYSQAKIKAGLVAIVSHFKIRPTSRTPKILIKDPFGYQMDVKGGLWLDFIRRQ